MPGCFSAPSEAVRDWQAEVIAVALSPSARYIDVDEFDRCRTS